MNVRPWILIFIMVALLTFAISGADKDFWSAKSYKEWSGKEVEKLLKNSPWSKAVHLSAQALGARGSGVSGRGAAPGSGARDATPDLSPPDTVVYVNWYARPIREALARQATLINPQAPAGEIERILNYDSSASLDFVLAGLPARMIFGSGPDALEKLKAETYLLKKNRVRIPASAVTQPGGRNQPLIFRFPRKGPGGDLITVDDKEIVLVTEVQGNALRANFKLAEMIVNGKPEL